MKKLFCAGMALLIAGSSWAIENLRFSTGDSIYYVDPKDSAVFITFDFEHPGDTVSLRLYCDVNRNLMIDQAEMLGPTDLRIIVDGGENDADNLVNGKWRSPGSSNTNSGIFRNQLQLLFTPDTLFSVIYKFTDKNGSQQAVLVAPLGLPRIIDTVLTGHIYSENGALIETGLTVYGPVHGMSQVTDGSYALGAEEDTMYSILRGYIQFGPLEALKYMHLPYDTSAYAESLRNLVYVTKATIQNTPDGQSVRKTLDLYYDLTPTVVNITTLDTITGDTVRDPQLEMSLDLRIDENCMAPYYTTQNHSFDTLATGHITRHLYMGKYDVSVFGVGKLKNTASIATFTVLAGDTVLNITLKVGSIPSAVSSGKNKPMAHELGLSVAVGTEARHGVCMDWTGAPVVRVEISSLDGGKVMTYRPASGLTNGRIIWDGTTLAGHRAAPGVYLVRFETGTREYIKKAMLIH